MPNMVRRAMRGKGVVVRRLALSVLRAAVADAGGDPGVYVSRAQIMEQTGITDLEEFVRVA